MIKSGAVRKRSKLRVNSHRSFLLKVLSLTHRVCVSAALLWVLISMTVSKTVNKTAFEKRLVLVCAQK